MPVLKSEFDCDTIMVSIPREPVEMPIAVRRYEQNRFAVISPITHNTVAIQRIDWTPVEELKVFSLIASVAINGAVPQIFNVALYPSITNDVKTEDWGLVLPHIHNLIKHWMLGEIVQVEKRAVVRMDVSVKAEFMDGAGGTRTSTYGAGPSPWAFSRTFPPAEMDSIMRPCMNADKINAAFEKMEDLFSKKYPNDPWVRIPPSQ
jgi:hypothetical protein